MITMVTIRCPSCLQRVGDVTEDRGTKWIQVRPDSDDGPPKKAPMRQMLELQADRRYTRCADCDIDVRLEVDIRAIRALVLEAKNTGEPQTFDARVVEVVELSE